ncbi:MAG TPA: peptidylprolyl isomerase [Longimicrobiales bacterium]|nr:peptidylprolyl isomerase [Longimicrobiales bacterium]
MSPRVRALLKEPLVHFLALGAVLFLIGRATGDETGPMGSRIVVSPGQIEQLASGFAATWQRPPTENELRGLVEDHIREEVYFRESLALGLDRGDIIIRRRLRQKMEFLTQDLADAVEPTEEELQAYLDEHVDDYRIPPRYTLSQEYFRGERTGDAGLEAQEAVAALSDPSDPTRPPRGDGSMLPPRLDDVPSREVARVFGEQFLEGIADLPVGRWSGPVESGYGMHLVYVGERIEGRRPTLDEVRPFVLRDWTAARRDEVNDAVYQRMLDQYTVVVERPDGTEERWTGRDDDRGVREAEAAAPRADTEADGND